MDFLDVFNALNYSKLSNENSQEQMEKVIALANGDFKEIIESSFRVGFDGGEKNGRQDENLLIRAKIVSKLFSKTELTNEEIFETVGFGEEKWIDYISNFRKQYEEGKTEGKAEIFNIRERLIDSDDELPF